MEFGVRRNEAERREVAGPPTRRAYRPERRRFYFLLATPDAEAAEAMTLPRGPQAGEGRTLRSLLCQTLDRTRGHRNPQLPSSGRRQQRTTPCSLNTMPPIGARRSLRAGDAGQLGYASLASVPCAPAAAAVATHSLHNIDQP